MPLKQPPQNSNNNISIEEIEMVLQDSFSKDESSSIDKDFQSTLRTELLSEHTSYSVTNKHNSHTKRDNTQYNTKKKKNKLNFKSFNMSSNSFFAKARKDLQKFFQETFSSTKRIALAGGFLVTLLLTTGLGFWYFFLADSQTPNAPSHNTFAQLTTVKGDVIIKRDDEEIAIKGATKEQELESGDIIETTDETIADVETDFGRISLADNTEITIDAEDDTGRVDLAKGTLYTRAESGNTIKTVTQNGEVSVEEGAALTQYLGDQGTNIKSIAGNVTGTAIQENTKVSKQITIGKEITITNNDLSDEKEFDRQILKNDFTIHCLEKDEQEGFDKGTGEDITPPELTIKQPKDNSTTKNSSITLKAVSNENGWAYYNKKWHEIEAEKEFSYKVDLKQGENNLTVKVKDKHYNRTTKKISVIYDKPESISLTTVYAQSNGIYLKWSATGTAPNYTYLVRRSRNATESGNQNNVLVIKANAAIKEWVDTSTQKGVKYYYHVILLGGNGKEVARTATKGTTAVNAPPESPSPPKPEQPEDNSCSISLWLHSKSTAQLLGMPTISVHDDKGSATVKWSVSGDCGEYSGFKVVWNKTGSPTYPDDSWHYVSSSTNTDKITGLSSGTWYIRVGTYKSGVKQYSNQISVGI